MKTLQAPDSLALATGTGYTIVVTPPPRGLLHELLRDCLVLTEDWESLSIAAQQDLACCRDHSHLLHQLVELRLLTQYQADRIETGKTYGLKLGNYRVLNRLGAGGMGIVFKGEHIRLRQPVAIKVLPLFLSRQESQRSLMRFYAEVRAVAKLQHPNVVRALDAGEIHSEEKGSPVLHYYVMEYVEGSDMEEYVRAHGPLAVGQACDLIYQVAGALEEAHAQGMVHRDIKPSNVMITPKFQAKLLDFGLVRQFRQRVTEPGTLLGTVDYVAPEQALNASNVDIRADIYSLGGTLFWLLAARPPFQPQGNIAQEMVLRQTQPPPGIRDLRPDVPAELEAVIQRMLAPNPDNRYPRPQSVMNALIPFLQSEMRERHALPENRNGDESAAEMLRKSSSASSPHGQRVLIVDDEENIRFFCKHALQSEGMVCDEAADGAEALALLTARKYDLVLLDWAMPRLNGNELCKKIRENPPTPHLKVVMFSGHAPSDEMAQMLSIGADDYLHKPFTVATLVARVKAALRLKDAQDRADLLNRRLLAINHQLEQNLSARDCDLIHARNALVLALAKLVSHRDIEPAAHLTRLQRFTRCLAETAAGLPSLAEQIDLNFIQTLESCVPLHDIGKVGLPDHILLKEGRLDADERIIMQSHTIIGAETLRDVAKQHGPALGFLQMAMDVARHHHERFDGKGYPDKLRGHDIPLAARIVAIGDVYDALRTRRPYKPALTHAAALEIMFDASAGQFDPVLLQALQRSADEFDGIFKEFAD